MPIVFFYVIEKKRNEFLCAVDEFESHPATSRGLLQAKTRKNILNH